MPHGRLSPGVEPPYYAVVFSSHRVDAPEGYGEMADRMMALAAEQPGYLGVESVSDGTRGITVSYWRDTESIAAWRRVADHVAAQRLGRSEWYRNYSVRVTRVEREYEFEAG